MTRYPETKGGVEEKMGERITLLTAAADEASELLRLMQSQPEAIDPIERAAELETAERLRARILEAEHVFRDFMYKFKAGSRAQPHQYLRQQERELRRMGVLVDVDVPDVPGGQGKEKGEPVSIRLIHQEETVLVG